eukprot:366460-Chlamydomonas_euryale.AAC.4
MQTAEHCWARCIPQCGCIAWSHRHTSSPHRLFPQVRLDQCSRIRCRQRRRRRSLLCRSLTALAAPRIGRRSCRVSVLVCSCPATATCVHWPVAPTPSPSSGRPCGTLMQAAHRLPPHPLEKAAEKRRSHDALPSAVSSAQSRAEALIFRPVGTPQRTRWPPERAYGRRRRGRAAGVAAAAQHGRRRRRR